MISLVKKYFGENFCEFGFLNGSEVVKATKSNEYKSIREEIGYTPITFSKFIQVSLDSEEILDTLVTKNVIFMNCGDNKTGYILSEAGTIDVVVSIYKNNNDILIEVAEWDYGKIKSILNEVNCEFVETDLYCLLIEGPDSMNLFTEVFDIALEYMSFQSHEYFDYMNKSILIARTGYTGEFGYKIIANGDSIEVILDKLAEMKAENIVGIDVFRQCMLEVKQPDWTLSYTQYSKNIFEIDYQWLIDFKKDTDYRGKDALYNVVAKNISYNTIGAVSEVELMLGSKINVDGQVIGSVIDCKYSNTLEKYLCMLMINKAYAQSGFEYYVDDSLISTVSAPYIVPKSWTVGKEEA